MIFKSLLFGSLKTQPICQLTWKKGATSDGMASGQATFHRKGGTLYELRWYRLSQEYSHVTAIDEAGKVIRSKRLENKPEPFREFFKGLQGPSEAVLEASRTWGSMSIDNNNVEV